MQATARRSIFKRLKIESKGGTTIGINAMCTGSKFWDEIENKSKIPSSIYLNQAKFLPVGVLFIRVIIL